MLDTHPQAPRDLRELTVEETVGVLDEVEFTFPDRDVIEYFAGKHRQEWGVMADDEILALRSTRQSLAKGLVTELVSDATLRVIHAEAIVGPIVFPLGSSLPPSSVR